MIKIEGNDLFHSFIPGHLVEHCGRRGEVVGYGDEWFTVRFYDDSVRTFDIRHHSDAHNVKIRGIR